MFRRLDCLVAAYDRRGCCTSVPRSARLCARLAKGTLIPIDAKSCARRVSICGSVNPASVCRRLVLSVCLFRTRTGAGLSDPADFLPRVPEILSTVGEQLAITPTACVNAREAPKTPFHCPDMLRPNRLDEDRPLVPMGALGVLR